ncbi:MAG: hypothetical protein WB473_06290 [Pedococcus sp.]
MPSSRSVDTPGPAQWSRVQRAVMWLVLAAVLVSVGVGGVEAAGWWSPPSSALGEAGDSACVSPPCGPESLPDLAVLPVVLPVLLTGVAALLGITVLLVSVARGAGRGRGSVPLLLALGPLVVLVGAEVVPHALNPCLAGDIPGVCTRTREFGTDYADDVHLLGHAVFGWLPLGLGFAWLTLRSARRRGR